MAKYKLLLPKMGESVAEATVIKWSKNPGDYIEADETVMEIATDKVDSDVPSPVSGKLLEQLYKENDVVQVGSVIAIIETGEPEIIAPSTTKEGSAVDRVENDTSVPVDQKSVEPAESEPIPAAPDVFTPPQEPWTEMSGETKQPVFEEQRKEFEAPVPYTEQLEKKSPEVPENLMTGGQRFYSPLVRSIAAQEGISNEELDKITGTGADGRLTKDDLLAHIQNKMQPEETAAPVGEATVSNESPATFLTGEIREAPAEETYIPEFIAPATEGGPEISGPVEETIEEQPEPGAISGETNIEGPLPEAPAETPAEVKQEPVMETPPVADAKKQEEKEHVPSAGKSVSGGDEIIEMDRMRRLIADHMVMSTQTAPHVTSFVEADVTNLVQWREKVKSSFEKREGQKITYMPVFIEAVVKAIKDFPMINVSVNGTQIIKKKNINISMAAALPGGNLIVPVIKNADELSLIGLTRAVNDLADRARNNQLKPDDVQGGTFTITNIGSFGNIMGTPIINQPQVAILAVGAIKKKVAVIETPEGDVIGIRHMMYLSLSYDHRVVDGALGGSFLKKVADYLEAWDSKRGI